MDGVGNNTNNSSAAVGGAAAKGVTYSNNLLFTFITMKTLRTLLLLVLASRSLAFAPSPDVSCATSSPRPPNAQPATKAVRTLAEAKGDEHTRCDRAAVPRNGRLRTLPSQSNLGDERVMSDEPAIKKAAAPLSGSSRTLALASSLSKGDEPTRCDEQATKAFVPRSGRPRTLLSQSNDLGDEPVMNRRDMMISTSLAAFTTVMGFPPPMAASAIESSTMVLSPDFNIIIDRMEAGEPDSRLLGDIKELCRLVRKAGGLPPDIKIETITAAVRMNKEEGESPSVDKA